MDWQEYPECPYCGATQDLAGVVLIHTVHRCYACGRKYTLLAELRFHTEKLEG